ncbi:MAG: tripartite tricarboxylate transporter substrate binding protein [Burkholderiaceae bacterium]
MHALRWLAGLLIAVLPLAAQAADPYPVRPIKLLVGFAPGGATDQLARLYAQKLGERIGQPVVVENRPGAGGNIAVHAVAQSPADGYTLVMAANYVAVNAALDRNPYDWQRDLAPVALIASTPNLLVVPAGSPLRSVDDLVRAVKTPDRRTTFGSPGVGSSVHMSGELFKALTGGRMEHIPYRGVAPAELDLVAGTIDLMFDSISTAVPLVQSGKLRALAVTSRQRAKSLPEVPTMAESGLKDFDTEAIYMVVAPAGTPDGVVRMLSARIDEITQLPDVRKFIEGLYAMPLRGDAAATAALLRAEQAKWVNVVKLTGVKAE